MKHNSSAYLTHRRHNPKDEFYTQFEDVKNEIESYNVDVWEGKTILLPCDAKWSAFYRYFAQNFTKLKLKCLYASSIEGTLTKITKDGIEETALQGDMFYSAGDFRSFAVKELFKQSDIIITNPPFSLTLQFLKQIIAYNKQYLIISHLATSNCSFCFSEFKRGNLTTGNTNNKGCMEFELHGDYDNGGKLARVAACFLTNLPTKEKSIVSFDVQDSYIQELDRYKEFPDVVNIERIDKIPTNYKGVMGVPVTYMRKHNGRVFEVLGRNGYENNSNGLTSLKTGKVYFGRIFIKRR